MSGKDQPEFFCRRCGIKLKGEDLRMLHPGQSAMCGCCDDFWEGLRQEANDDAEAEAKSKREEDD